jgi:hypothetical protein
VWGTASVGSGLIETVLCAVFWCVQVVLSYDRVRLNCIRLIEAVPDGAPVFVRRFSLHRRRVPWETEDDPATDGTGAGGDNGIAKI